jgi:hypothetical protein
VTDTAVFTIDAIHLLGQAFHIGGVVQVMFVVGEKALSL